MAIRSGRAWTKPELPEVAPRGLTIIVDLKLAVPLSSESHEEIVLLLLKS